MLHFAYKVSIFLIVLNLSIVDTRVSHFLMMLYEHIFEGKEDVSSKNRVLRYKTHNHIHRIPMLMFYSDRVGVKNGWLVFYIVWHPGKNNSIYTVKVSIHYDWLFYEKSRKSLL